MLKENISFIIIGAAGFIGSSFSAYLKNSGFAVINVFRDNFTGADEGQDFVNSLLKFPDTKYVIVDFAYTSVPNTSFNDPVRDFSENLYNVIRHLEIARQLPGASYIYISSGGTVYGNTYEFKPIGEDHANVPVAPYGITKLACEKYVLMYKEVYGLDVKIVRPSNIYGPGQQPFRGQGLVATAIAKVLQNKPVQVFGDGLQVRDYLFIDDFAAVLLDVITFGDAHTVYNTGSGTGNTIKEILETIQEVIGETLSIEYLPFRPFDVRYSVLDCSAVSALNGWTPITSLADGIRLTGNWLKKAL